jgi:hypothetical protein
MTIAHATLLLCRMARNDYAGQWTTIEHREFGNQCA